MAFKCCRTCKECRLDLRAIWICGILIDRCALKQKYISHPWLSGWWCKDWRAEDGKA